MLVKDASPVYCHRHDSRSGFCTFTCHCFCAINANVNMGKEQMRCCQWQNLTSQEKNRNLENLYCQCELSKTSKYFSDETSIDINKYEFLMLYLKSHNCKIFITENLSMNYITLSMNCIIKSCMSKISIRNVRPLGFIVIDYKELIDVFSYSTLQLTF